MQENILKDQNNPYGPVEVGEIIIEVDKDACIGASACLPLAEKTFALDENGKAVILATAGEDDREAILDAARACPVLAIKITEKATGKQIFPE